MLYIVLLSIVSLVLLTMYLVKYIKIGKESKEIMKAFEVGKVDIFRENYKEV